MSLSMTQSTALSMRQEMVTTLRQHLVQKLVMTMALYIEREDAFKTLYAGALKRGDVRRYEGHGLAFEYARIRRRELPPWLVVEGGCGFAHCLFNAWKALFSGHEIAKAQGSWLLFVVSDFFSPAMPEPYQLYVAVHEHGEEVSLGQHHLATKLEFAIAHQEKQLMAYLGWLEEHYPSKFADVFANHTRIVLPESDEFQRVLELRSTEAYACRVRTLMEGFEWPHRVLQKLQRYQQKAAELETAVNAAFHKLASLIDGFAGDQGIPSVIAALTRSLRRNLVEAVFLERYACWANMEEHYQALRALSADAFNRYRDRRQKSLLLQWGETQGMSAYLEEVAAIGTDGTLPRTGLFSTRLREVFAAMNQQ